MDELRDWLVHAYSERSQTAAPKDAHPKNPGRDP